MGERVTKNAKMGGRWRERKQMEIGEMGENIPSYKLLILDSRVVQASGKHVVVLEILEIGNTTQR